MKYLQNVFSSLLAAGSVMGMTLSASAAENQESIVLANVPCEISDGSSPRERLGFTKQSSDHGGYYCSKYGWDGWQFTVAMADNGLIAEPVEGYKFDGWYTMTENRGQNDGLDINDATVQISKNATIEWKEIKNAKTFDSVPFVVAKYVQLYKVTLDKQGGNGGSDSVEVAKGDEMPEIEPPSRDGYEFLGYFTKTGTEGTQYYSDMGKGKVTSYDLSKDITLYAHWQGKKFVVTFDDRGPDIKDGQGKLEVTLGEEGEALSVSVKIPTATERTFLGYWNEELDERFWDEEGTWKGGVWTVPSNVVVRAHWKANEYMVKFNENGGSGKYSDVSVAMNVPFELPDGGELAKENHVFAGWALSSDAKEAKYEGGATIRIADDKTALVDGAITYYAFWQDMRRTVHFHADSKAILSTNELQKTAGQAYGELPTASWPNDWYAFDGWWTTDGSRISEDTLVPVDSSTIDLYAHWTTNSYYIAFDGREPTSGEMSVQEFKFDMPAALTKNAFLKTGYSFAGWATNIGAAATLSDGAVVSNLLATTKNETNTLHAVWKGYDYTVRFFGNGGLGTMSPQSFTYGEAKKLTSNWFTREGYEFAGWATDPTNGVVYVDGELVSDLTTVAGGRVALFAKWRSNMAVSELSIAADCNNLNLTTNKVGWTVEEYKPGEERVGQNNQYLRTTTSGYLETEIFGPGVLTFQYKVLSTDVENIFYLYETVGDKTKPEDPPLLKSESTSSWQAFTWTNENTTAKIKLQWQLSVLFSGFGDYALLDNVRWTPGAAPTNWVGVTFRLNDGTPSPVDVYYNKTYMSGQPIGALPVPPDRDEPKFKCWTTSPEGGKVITPEWIVPDFDTQLYAWWGDWPVPGPGDAADVSAAKVADGKFTIEFESSAVFDYLLMTNGDLSVKSWGELEHWQGDGNKHTFKPAVDPAQPQLFYRIDTIQRQ